MPRRLAYLLGTRSVLDPQARYGYAALLPFAAFYPVAVRLTSAPIGAETFIGEIGLRQYSADVFVFHRNGLRFRLSGHVFLQGAIAQ